MTEPSRPAQVAAAESFEALFVSSEFASWAPRVAQAAAIAPGQRVLDVACGTGALARHIASVVGFSGAVAGIDIDAGMIEVARRLAPGIDWRLGSADALPFDDAAFDRVVSQFGLMFFPDRLRALCEAHRVLVQGGRIAFAVWDSLGTLPAYAAEVALVERVAGREAADALRLPFVLGDVRELMALFGAAGFDSVHVATEQGRAVFPSIRALVTADLKDWLPSMGVSLDADVIHRISDEAERVLAPYVDSDGRLIVESSAHIVTGARP